MKIERSHLQQVTAHDSFGRSLVPSSNGLIGFTCMNSSATDIFIKLVFKQKNIIKKLVNTSRNITIESSKNCTHFSIEGLVKKQALRSTSSIIELSDSNGNQVELKQDMNTLNLHLECCDPENKKPFSFYSIIFNSKQKRKNPENFFIKTPENNNSNSPELEYVGTTIPELNEVTANDVVCIDDQRPPSPVRTAYPHFDNITEPIDKCPVCYMEFKRSEIERHTQLCCEKTFSNNVRDTFSGGCSSLDHPSTMPAKNRRIIHPKI